MGCDKIAQLEKKYNDATLAASKFAKTALVFVWDSLSALALPFSSSAGAMSAFKDAAEKAEKAATSAAKAAKKEADETKNTVDPYQALIDKLKAAAGARNDNADASKKVAKAVDDEAKAVKKAADDNSTAVSIFYDGYDKELTANAVAFYDNIQKNKAALVAGADAMSLSVAGYYEGYEKELTANTLLVYETANKNKDAEIDAAKKSAAEKTRLAEQLPGMYRQVYGDMKGYAKGYYDYAEQAIADQASLFHAAGMDSTVLAAWVTGELKKEDDKRLLANGTFWEGMKKGYDDDVEAQKTWAEQGRQVWFDLHEGTDNIIDKGVDAFQSGEDALKLMKEETGKEVARISGKYAKEAFSNAIEHTVSLIGAYIGEGAASTGAKAASGGVWAAIGEIALYLGTGVAGMLGGKALAQQFKAEGGWIANHPDGGFINQGSGYRDDVYLGRTENARHWGMGGEFVVNKDASREYASLLQAINGGYLNTVSDRRFADGGWVGDNGQKLVGDPDNLAERMAAGGWLCFASGFGTEIAAGGDIYAGIAAGIAADVAYITEAAGGAIGGKALADLFKASGGEIRDVGHSLWRAFLPPSWQHTLDITQGRTPGPVDVPVIPGIMNFKPGTLFDNNDPASIESWLEDAWRSFMDTQRAGWRNYAEVVLEPGNNSMDVIGALGHELDHFYKHIIKTTGLLIKPPGHTWAWEDEAKACGGFVSARNGLDYVPGDNFPIIAHKGERVQTASEVDSLGAKVDALTEAVKQMAFLLTRNTGKTAKLLEKFDVIGLPARE